MTFNYYVDSQNGHWTSKRQPGKQPNSKAKKLIPKLILYAIRGLYF